MSFDLAELQSKVNNYTTVVGSWMKNVGNLYFSATPQNVSVKLLDENGNVKTNTIPNVAQFRKQVWDDIGSASGQFNKTLYVDAINGVDTNTGLSTSSPFKTISKAIDSVPTGGYAVIKVLSDLTLEEKDFKNKVIEINMQGHILNSTEGASKITVRFGGLTINSGTLNNTSPDRGKASWDSGMIRTWESKVVFNSITFNEENENSLVSNDNAISDISVAGCSINLIDGSIVANWMQGVFSFRMYNTPVIMNGTGTYVNGTIVRDADSGNPLNILSNINLSS